MSFIRKITLPNRILIGFVLGILIGLFFGERVIFLKVVGNGFIQLLQMAVLPFVSFSLMAGLGQMTFSTAKNLAKKGFLVLLFLWAISFGIILLIPLNFPEWQSATYFSNSLITTTEDFDFLNLFIPTNPFNAYANNVVPAVVVFSMAIGIALMGIKNKQGLLNGLNVINEALIKITNFVVKLAPIGVFAISANAAGTLAIEDVNKIQVYFITYIVFALITSFYLFPALISTLTPIKYRDIIMKNRGLLITAFATANLFVVLSLLITRSKEMLVAYDIPEEDAEKQVGVIIPTAINFPSAGKLFSLSFLAFAGWFSGTELVASEMPKLIILGFFTFFGNPIAALEFLLDFFRIPIDTLQLYLLSDIVISRFGTLVAAMFYIALSLITTFSMHAPLKFKPLKVITYVSVSIGLIIVSMIGLKILFNKVYEDNYHGSNTFKSMDLIHEKVPYRVLDEATVIPDNPYFSSLESIQRRGYLRVGYYNDALPYAFFNNDSVLVGYDVDLAHALAKDINVTLEFLEIPREDLQFTLDNNIVDLVMCGVYITTNQNISYSNVYSKGTIAFLVPDHKRQDFNSREAVRSQDSLALGILGIPYYVDKIATYLPDAKITNMNSPRNYLDGGIELDAFVMSAEAASAWTLIYPNYSVALPYPDILSAPLGIAISQNNSNFVSYLNTWIELKNYDSTFENLTEYWIYGKVEKKEKTRWNMLDAWVLKQEIE